jgi:glutathione synthase/RimK-type ligase-like ATP-grasp enzyme
VPYARRVDPAGRLLLVVGYQERLADDHRALVAAAVRAGFDARLVDPSALGVVVDEHGATVTVGGTPLVPDVALPRGVNRPWGLVRHALEVWRAAGCIVVPDVEAADICADKIATARVLARSGVPFIPSLGVVPGGQTVIDLPASTGVVVKPARGSKANGLAAFPDTATAEESLRRGRPLVDGSVDHQVVQARATGAGVDYRVVVAGRSPTAVAVTRRTAGVDGLVTNGPDATVVDVTDPERTASGVVDVALAAARAIGLTFGGIDVIEHHGRPVILEANAWPGLAVDARGDALAEALVATAADLL